MLTKKSVEAFRAAADHYRTVEQSEYNVMDGPKQSGVLRPPD